MNYSANQCHYCFRKSTSSNNLFVAKCCKNRCNKAYCINCINSHFDNEFVQERYKKDTWICYSCQDRCNCTNCGGIDKVSKDLKNSKRKTKSSQLSNKNQESDISVNNSARLQSQLILRNDLQSSQNNRIIINQQQQMEVQEKKQTQGFSENQVKKSSIKVKPIKKDKVKQFMQEKNTFPPYLQKIIQRKKLFYNFIETKTKKTLQQLLDIEPDATIQQEEEEVKPIMTRRNTEKQISKEKGKNEQFKNNEKQQKQQKRPKILEQIVKVEQKPDKIIDAKKLKQIINNQMKEYEISEDDQIELLQEE